MYTGSCAHVSCIGLHIEPLRRFPSKLNLQVRIEYKFSMVLELTLNSLLVQPARVNACKQYY